jgi:hypothetical protein
VFWKNKKLRSVLQKKEKEKVLQFTLHSGSRLVAITAVFVLDRLGSHRKVAESSWRSPWCHRKFMTAIKATIGSLEILGGGP